MSDLTEAEIESETKAMIEMAGGSWDKIDDVRKHGIALVISRMYRYRAELQTAQQQVTSLKEQCGVYREALVNIIKLHDDTVSECKDYAEKMDVLRPFTYYMRNIAKQALQQGEGL